MAHESKTLFVRNLPFSATNDALEKLFGEVGPIKQCFVVREKGSEKCRGFGYVIYSMREDAVKAKDEIKSLDGRKLFITYADKKKRQKKKKEKDGKETTESEENSTGVKTKEDNTEEDDSSKGIKTAKKDKTQSDRISYQRAKTVIAGGFPPDVTEEDFQHLLQKMNVKNVAKFSITSNNDKQEARILFKSVRDAKRGITKINGKQHKGHELTAVPLKQSKDRVIPQKVLKKSRLIIRNLSFKCSEDSLREAFQKFGDISEVKIPSRKDGSLCGFGFLQFTDMVSAQKAIDKMNAKPILGRPVAVDWAQPKDKFEAATKGDKLVKSDAGRKKRDADYDEGSFSTESDTTETVIKAVKSRISSNDESGDDDDNASDDEEEESSGDEGFGDDDNEDTDHNESEEMEDESEDDEKSKNANDEDESDTDHCSDLELDKSDIHSEKKYRGKPEKSQRKTDVSEGKTMFIRNLSFDSCEADIEELFSEFGELNYCKVVIDPNTEHSRGSAFIQFKDKEGANACLLKATDDSRSGGLELDGRRLIVTLAVTKEEAAKLQEKGADKKEKKDNRNLYLIREGMIRPGTQAAQGLSATDLEKRKKVETLKRIKLKNLNIFISPLRLCVRNIPVQVEDKELREIFWKAAGDKKAKIKECRIMRDITRVNSAGKAKSRGYAFVTFTEHHHALTALQTTNNNPEIFGEHKRLIVEFSLENKAALEAKQKRIERQMQKQEQIRKSKGDTSVEGDKKDKNVKKSKTNVLNMLRMSDKDKKLRAEQGGSKKLPSHSGPKIRHMPRHQQKKETKKNKKKPKGGKKGQKRTRPVDASDEAPKKKRKRGNKEVTDSFDRLVNQYKQKLLSASSKPGGRKWFDV
ncbi:hypothetical protein CHS0354_025760 [Potamilus streckersoni]|uniref:RRM domain-containing protein n=1 Tax=Potamilus streckersoni TaxID=2493646 RepID=A0AAE0VI88_9BIVA|nr:hypothetical protein CHS0354_025760 [Potamilus streckersoni]